MKVYNYLILGYFLIISYGVSATSSIGNLLRLPHVITPKKNKEETEGDYVLERYTFDESQTILVAGHRSHRSHSSHSSHSSHRSGSYHRSHVSHVSHRSATTRTYTPTESSNSTTNYTPSSTTTNAPSNNSTTSYTSQPSPTTISPGSTATVKKPKKVISVTSDSYFLQAISEMKKNKLDSASTYFKMTVKKYPKSWQVYYSYALCLYKQKEYYKAIDVLDYGKKYTDDKKVIAKFDNAILVVKDKINVKKEK